VTEEAARNRRFLRAAGLTGAAAGLSGILGACSLARASAPSGRPIRLGMIVPQTGALSGFGEATSVVITGLRRTLGDGLKFFARPGQDLAHLHPFKWTYHFMWGMHDIIRVYQDIWQQVPTNKVVGTLFPQGALGAAWAHPRFGIPGGFSGQGYRLRRRATWPRPPRPAASGSPPAPAPPSPSTWCWWPAPTTPRSRSITRCSRWPDPSGP
jgi:hypothetical protein